MKRWWEIWWGQSLILIVTTAIGGLIVWGITHRYDRPGATIGEQSPSPNQGGTVKREPDIQSPTQRQISLGDRVQSPATEGDKLNSVPKRPKTYPQSFQFLIGEWECMTAGNNYQMRVSWDSQSGQFLGYLTKQGQASQGVGFRIGERVWIAEPIDDQTFVERQKLRNGLGNSWWNNQNVDVRESSRDHLSAYGEFRRIQ